MIPILAKYHGELRYRIRPKEENYIHSTGEQPYEIHFVVFNSEQDFNNYIDDEERKTFMHLKKESIKNTIAIKGTAL